jgi:hypothetical protein
MNNASLPLLLALIAPLAVGCGSDPAVSYSAPVAISFNNIKPGASNAILENKNISQPSGNPWGKFLNDAKAKLGHDPSKIVVTGATIELLTSTSFTGLQDVFTGPVSVSFLVTTNPYQLVGVTNPTTAGPVPMSIVFGTFDAASMAAGDYASVLGSSFSVVLAGTAPTATSGANIQTTFTFVAYP